MIIFRVSVTFGDLLRSYTSKDSMERQNNLISADVQDALRIISDKLDSISTLLGAHSARLDQLENPSGNRDRLSRFRVPPPVPVSLVAPLPGTLVHTPGATVPQLPSHISVSGYNTTGVELHNNTTEPLGGLGSPLFSPISHLVDPSRVHFLAANRPPAVVAPTSIPPASHHDTTTILGTNGNNNTLTPPSVPPFVPPSTPLVNNTFSETDVLRYDKLVGHAFSSVGFFDGSDAALQSGKLIAFVNDVKSAANSIYRRVPQLPIGTVLEGVASRLKGIASTWLDLRLTTWRRTQLGYPWDSVDTFTKELSHRFLNMSSNSESMAFFLSNLGALGHVNLMAPYGAEYISGLCIEGQRGYAAGKIFDFLTFCLGSHRCSVIRGHDPAQYDQAEKNLDYAWLCTQAEAFRFKTFSDVEVKAALKQMNLMVVPVSSTGAVPPGEVKINAITTNASTGNIPLAQFQQDIQQIKNILTFLLNQHLTGPVHASDIPSVPPINVEYRHANNYGGHYNNIRQQNQNLPNSSYPRRRAPTNVASYNNITNTPNPNIVPTSVSLPTDNNNVVSSPPPPMKSHINNYTAGETDNNNNNTYTNNNIPSAVNNNINSPGRGGNTRTRPPFAPSNHYFTRGSSATNNTNNPPNAININALLNDPMVQDLFEDSLQDLFGAPHTDFSSLDVPVDSGDGGFDSVGTPTSPHH